MILKLFLFFYIFAIIEGESNSKIGLVTRCLSPTSPRFYYGIIICSAFGFGPYSALMKRVNTFNPKMKIQARAIPYMFDMDGEDW